MAKKDDDGVESGAALWQRVTRDVRKLPGRDSQPRVPATHKKAPPDIRKKQSARTASTPAPSPRSHPAGAGLDRRTEMKLQRGQMEIAARLDLHGMTQVQARTALEYFIADSHARGRRCVLVITGKGSLNKPGVIRARLKEWLAEGALADRILATAPAQPKDGGAGAVYVLLRRRR